MGYTHYWTQQQDIAKKEWSRISSGTTVLLANYPKVVAKGGYKGYPISIALAADMPLRPALVSGETIQFNGVGTFNGFSDMGHEPFWLTRKLECRGTKTPYGRLYSCHTARKPYDIVVSGVLLLASAVSPNTIVVSDWHASSFNSAIAWLKDLIGKGLFDKETTADILRVVWSRDPLLIAIGGR